MNAPVVIRHRLSKSQIAALSEIEGFQEAVPGMLEAIPAAEYVDPARFELEKQAIFQRDPFVLAPSAQIPKRNMYFQQEVLGVPVVVTRDREGVVRAFVNVCRHRGTILCPDAEPAEGSRLSCPYHAWTYKLDGTLMGVPREEMFPGLDKSKYHLVQLPCVEAGGLIYIGVRPGAEVDFSDVTGALAEDLDGIGMADMQVYRKVTYPLQANWKLVMDTMLDKYHVLRLHQNTLAKFFDDTPEVTHMVGPHVRSASGRAGFKSEDLSEDFEVIRRKSVLGYALYPNGVIVVSPRYVSFGVVRPISFERTDVDYYMLITDPPKNAEEEDKLKQSFDLMDIAFGKEDFWAAELGHKGLASGFIKEMLVGGLERRMLMFREVLLERLGRRTSDEVAHTA